MPGGKKSGFEIGPECFINGTEIEKYYSDFFKKVQTEGMVWDTREAPTGVPGRFTPLAGLCFLGSHLTILSEKHSFPNSTYSGVFCTEENMESNVVGVVGIG